jgi:hypothetical protein
MNADRGAKMAILFVLRSAFIVLGSFVIVIIITGCNNSKPFLTLRPSSNGRPFTASFTRAFWSPNQAGEDQIVLLNDPIDQNSAAGIGDPLQPRKAAPIRQMLVIQLQWQNASNRADTPASINAVLNWYVFGGGFDSIVHYTGSGHVSISPHGRDATVDIRRASMKLADKTGPLQDPLGDFTVDGAIDAVNSPIQFQQAIKDLSAAQTEAQRANEPASQPAATEPVGRLFRPFSAEHLGRRSGHVDVVVALAPFQR